MLTTAAEVPTELFAVHGYCAVNLRPDPCLPSRMDLSLIRGGSRRLIRAFARKNRRRLAGRGGRHSEATLILEVFQSTTSS